VMVLVMVLVQMGGEGSGYWGNEIRRLMLRETPEEDTAKGHFHFTPADRESRGRRRRRRRERER
jgi:hypothetical protein